METWKFHEWGYGNMKIHGIGEGKHEMKISWKLGLETRKFLEWGYRNMET